MAKVLTESDNLDTFKADVSSLKTAVDSIKTKYTNTLSSVKTSYTTASDFGTWEDDVAAKLKASLDRDVSKGSITAIGNDLTSGGMNQMVGLISKLLTTLDTCITSKNAYLDKKSKLSLPELVESGREDEEGKPIMVKNPNRPSASEVESLRTTFLGWLANANKILVDLAAVDFGGTIQESEMTPVETTPVSPFPDGSSKTENGMILIDQFTYDRYGETYTAQILIDPATGNRIVITSENDGTMYVSINESEVNFNVLQTDSEISYTYQSPVDVSDPAAVAAFLQSPEAQALLSNPDSMRAYDTTRFTGNQMLTEMHTGEGEVHTVTIGDTEVTFYTSETGSADDPFNT